VKPRWIATACVVVLVGAACGSRSDNGKAAKDDETSTTAASTSTDSPCGPGDATGATDTGVTDETIKIGTIQDLGGQLRPNLMIGPRQATEAFVAYCNSLGGVNGRQLELVKFDSEVLNHARAADEACAADVFAMVGSASSQDNQGAQKIVDCGLIDVPTLTGTAEHSAADNMVQPLPNPPDQWSGGPCKYLAEQYPDAVKKAAMTNVDYPVTQTAADRQAEGCGALGFDFVYRANTDALGAQNWGTIVKGARDAGAKYFTHWGEKEDLAQALINFQQQSYDLEVVDGGPQYYDPAFLELAGDAAEGVHIWTATVPLEEADSSPEMQTYLQWLEQTSPGAVPTELGVRAWSANLLFTTALAELGSDVTRAALYEQLKSIHEWDGNGIQARTDPGDDTLSCFMYLQVKDGKFAREYPDKGFVCDDDTTIELNGDYGQGAKKSG
jgi:ABC-type branched-subunit amino acid transport system substrate-binding protein